MVSIVLFIRFFRGERNQCVGWGLESDIVFEGYGYCGEVFVCFFGMVFFYNFRFDLKVKVLLRKLKWLEVNVLSKRIFYL